MFSWLDTHLKISTKDFIHRQTLIPFYLSSWFEKIDSNLPWYTLFEDNSYPLKIIMREIYTILIKQQKNYELSITYYETNSNKTTLNKKLKKLGEKLEKISCE